MKNNVFNQISVRKPKSNMFDLSHEVKLSFNMGQLVPTCLVECVPGDRFTVSSENMFRFAPMISPVMHRIKAYTHFFFVPTRILWPNWETFNTGSKDGKVVPAEELPVWPHVELGNIHTGELGDYLGLPTAIGSNTPVSALPGYAYRKVYFDYYRDQNLSDMEAGECIASDGLQSLNDDMYTSPLYRRAWQHDYFTSALPFAQKGEPVSLSVANFSDVDVYRAENNQDAFGLTGSGLSAGSGSIESIDGKMYKIDENGSHSVFVASDNWKADTSSLEVEAITINDLRRAERLQEWLEKNARGGSRYIESNEVHFGVKSSDKRLNRSEFIGGSSQNVVVSEVLQTSQTDDSATPQGNMAGHGISVGSGAPVNYFCEEHGFIIGITSVMPVTAYQQGIHRMFSRSSNLDYYWPSFAHLGEQEILNKELYVSGDSTDDETFGYIPRYSEYKYLNSRVAGDFRDQLDFWHLGRIFDSKPVLNENFIQCNPSDRIFAVTDPGVQHIYAHVFNNLKALRRMPVFGTPRL